MSYGNVSIIKIKNILKYKLNIISNNFIIYNNLVFAAALLMMLNSILLYIFHFFLKSLANNVFYDLLPAYRLANVSYNYNFINFIMFIFTVIELILLFWLIKFDLPDCFSLDDDDEQWIK